MISQSCCFGSFIVDESRPLKGVFIVGPTGQVKPGLYYNEKVFVMVVYFVSLFSLSGLNIRAFANPQKPAILMRTKVKKAA